MIAAAEEAAAVSGEYDLADEVAAAASSGATFKAAAAPGTGLACRALCASSADSLPAAAEELARTCLTSLLSVVGSRWPGISAAAASAGTPLPSIAAGPTAALEDLLPAAATAALALALPAAAPTALQSPAGLLTALHDALPPLLLAASEHQSSSVTMPALCQLLQATCCCMTAPWLPWSWCRAARAASLARS